MRASGFYGKFPMLEQTEYSLMWTGIASSGVRPQSSKKDPLSMEPEKNIVEGRSSGREVLSELALILKMRSHGQSDSSFQF
jgi:hypothetical protein